jgi:LPXTG-motif cell wall-anchored protein
MVNMNLGHAENHGTTHITSNNDHSYMNMTNTQLTMPSNHHVAGTNQPMTDHSGMVMTSSNMLTVPTTNHTDHTSNPTANPIQPTISHLATHTSTPTFGTGTPSTTHHEIATANPTYNAFHNSHLTAPVTSTTHDQHTLAATNPTSNQMTDHGHTTTSAPNNVITSDTHNGHPTPTSNNIVTSATHNSHTMSAQNITPVTSTESINNHQHNIKQTPMVISSNQINIKELPKTGVSSLILLGLTTIISLLYLKKRSRQIEIMTANGLWTQMQLNKSINK